MQVNIYNNIQAELPSDWTVDKGDDVISIFNAEKGLGALQLSIFRVESVPLLNLKDELIDLVDTPISNVFIENSCAKASYLDQDDNRYWRYWLFLKQDNLFFATYNCEASDRYKEDAIIDKIVESLIDQ